MDLHPQISSLLLFKMADGVFAGTFSQIYGTVGHLQQLFRIFRIKGEGGDAAADGNFEFLLAV